MSATERLRKMLDERGVEWMPVAWNPKRETFYHAANGVGFCADEYTDGVKIYTDATITPEQAVEATLGRGTCRMEKRHMDWRCTGCGEIVGTDDTTSELFIDGNAVELWRYCPNCGRKVVGA